MKIVQLRNSKGNSIPNQWSIQADDGTIFFQSYNSIIAKVKSGKIILDGYYWNYSKTTSKYLFMFLNMNRKEVLEKIKNNEISFSNLN